ncbi:hypothetical protein GHK92_03505 [Nocardioides sp. dk4132]|uniref:DUF6167 family protein n=1 Tax=unclassified Nocardioides TaxID=2615069 RepID=UPI001294D08F|nr:MULTISPECIES: DUF6167 family protein [unclassified Nocardioides]MQW74929.1 hypothetical protein [Nocardioides sp. dk4132]QGA07883.1 hypothetical protein GFH29_11105 [Nocardioides sp. dk884]
MSRGLWFVAGAGAGLYAAVRGRRAAEALSPDGMRDRVNGLVAGARLLRQEVAQGAAEAEPVVRERLGLTDTGPRALAPPRPSAQPAAPTPQSLDTRPETAELERGTP